MTDANTKTGTNSYRILNGPHGPGREGPERSGEDRSLLSETPIVPVAASPVRPPPGSAIPKGKLLEDAGKGVLDVAFGVLKQLEGRYPRLAPSLYRHARKSLDVVAAVDEVKRLIAIHEQPTFR